MASSYNRNTWTCLGSSKANCVRYISSPRRPSDRHGRHERLDFVGYRFLPGGELRAQLEGEVAFVAGQLFPVRAIAGEVDVGGVPELRVAACE